MTTLQLQSSEFKPKHHESALTHVRQSHFHSDGPNNQTDSLNISLETVTRDVCVLHHRSGAASILVTVCVYPGCVCGTSPVQTLRRKYAPINMHHTGLLIAQDDDCLSVTSRRCDISSLFFPSVFSQEKNHLVFLCDVFSPTSD